MRECTLTINDKEIKIPDIATVSWGFSAGSKAQQTNLAIPYTLAKSLKFSKCKLTLNDLFFENLYITNISYLNESFTTVEISDIRFFWQYKSLTQRAYIYNKVRYAGIKQNFNNWNNASIIAYRYNSNTINSGKPWTMFQILLDILKNDLEIEPMISDYTDNNYVKDNLNFLGASVGSVIQQLCEEAECLLYVDEAGDIIISDANVVEIKKEFDKSKINGKIEFNGELGKPSKIRVSFIKEKEIAFGNGLTDTYNIQNVVQIPYNSDDFGLINGNSYNAGSYIPWIDLLGKIGIDEVDWLMRLPQNNGIYVAMGITKGMLKEYTGNFQKKERKKIQLANLLFNSYRTTWRISETYMDKLLNIKPFMITIEDEYTKTRKPSEVRCDYCAKHAFFDPKDKNSQVLVNFPKSAETAPVNVGVNNELGIITLSFGSDVFGLYSSRFFGQFRSNGFVKDFANVYDARIEKPMMSLTFRLEVIVSASEIDDYTYSIEKDLKYDYGEGVKDNKEQPLILDIFSDKITAGYDKYDTLVNGDTLDLIAQTYADIYSFSWQDKPTGQKTIDFDSSYKAIEGSLKQIKAELGNGVDRTKFICTPTIRKLPNFNKLPSSIKQLYFDTLGG